MASLTARHFWIASVCFVFMAGLFIFVFLRGRSNRSAGDWLYLVSALISVCAALAFVRSAMLLGPP
jgi:hypothetical protein